MEKPKKNSGPAGSAGIGSSTETNRENLLSQRTKSDKTTKKLAAGSLIAAMYVASTFLTNLFGLASGAVQIRVSEALCILPCFTSSAVPGLFIGCLLANLVTGALLPDIIFGSLATLIGAVGTLLLRKNRCLAVLPPILANTVIVPLVLEYSYKLEDSLPFLFMTVGIGEVISAGILGQFLYSLIDRNTALKNLLAGL